MRSRTYQAWRADRALRNGPAAQGWQAHPNLTDRIGRRQVSARAAAPMWSRAGNAACPLGYERGRAKALLWGCSGGGPFGANTRIPAPGPVNRNGPPRAKCLSMRGSKGGDGCSRCHPLGQRYAAIDARVLPIINAAFAASRPFSTK